MLNYSTGVCDCVPGYMAISGDNKTGVPKNGTACKFPCPANAACVIPPDDMIAFTRTNWSCPVCDSGGEYGGDAIGSTDWPATTELLTSCAKLGPAHRSLLPIPNPNRASCESKEDGCAKWENVCDYCYTQGRALVTCEEGFYDTQPSQSWPVCEQCPPLMQAPDGFYQPRCSNRLQACAYPPLGPNQQYGRADSSLLPIPAFCAETWPYTSGIDTDLQGTPKECRFYLTPLYTMGACKLMCRTGAYWNGSACVACAPSCAPGEQPDPRCTAPTQAQGDAFTGACIPCTDVMPAHAQRVNECQWSCETGMYRNATHCKPCQVGTCSEQGARYMGCTGWSPGGCVQCALQATDCTQGVTFLYVGIDATTCECRACTPRLPGWTRQAECTIQSDALWRQCAPCADDTQYVSLPCTESRDTICADCQPVQDGHLLVSACNSTHDAVYTTCPVGFACNGSAYPQICTWPEVLDGTHCICGAGYTRLQTQCVVMQCEAAGHYPTVNGTCEPCFTQRSVDSVEALVRADTFGREACVCPSSTHAVGTEGCWPDGTLDCTPIGRVQVGHECVCFVPFASHTVDPMTCAYECDEGYYTAAGEGYAAVGRLYPFREADWKVDLQQGEIRGAIAQPAVLLLANNRFLLLEAGAYEDGASILGQMDTPFMQGVEFTAVAPYEEDTMWMSFTYTGICDPPGGGEAMPGLFCAGLFVYNTVSRAPMWDLSVDAPYSAYGGIYAMAGSILAQHDGATLYIVAAHTRHVLWSSPSTRRITSLAITSSYAFGTDGLNLFQWSSQEWTLQKTWLHAAGRDALFVVDAERIGVGLDGFLDARNDILQGSSAFAVVAANGARRLVAYEGGEAKLYLSQAACPPDHHAYADACVLMPCIRSDPYGPNAWRDGSCKPGYVRQQQQCVACPLSFYCTNGSQAHACPPNAITPHTGAVGLRNCECKPGYYSYGAACMPCDTFSWCVGGVPIPCTNGGSTTYAASTSPLQCKCPPRTYGLDCKPCPTHAICAPPLVAPAALLVVRFVTSSPPPDAEVVIARPNGWYVVLSLPASSSVPPDAYDFARCPGTSCTPVSTLQPCGPHHEWNGETATTLQRCECGGGYYAVGGTCRPCAAGTVRPAHSEWSECVPCSNVSLHAPYAGMTACVCSESTDVVTGECVLRHTVLPSEWFRSQTLCIAGTASTAVLVLLLALLCAR